ncbi:hypothetical protein RUND412_010632 [Rhizina undulata]
MNSLLQSLLQKLHAPGLQRPRREDPVPEPAIEETQEELEEVMPTTIGRVTKRKVAKKTVGPSKRTRGSARESRKMNPPLRLSPRRVVVAILLPLNPKNIRAQEIKEPEEPDLTQAPPTRIIRGRKAAPKGTTKTSKAARSQSVHEADAKEESVAVPGDKPTRARGRKVEEFVIEPESEAAEPVAEQQPVRVVCAMNQARFESELG